MRSFVAACAFLALTVAAAVSASVWLGGAAGEVRSRVEALPPPTEAAEGGTALLRQVDGIASAWERRRRGVALLAGEREAAAVTAAVGSLRAAAESRDPGGFGAAREDLLAALREITLAAGPGL